MNLAEEGHAKIISASMVVHISNVARFLCYYIAKSARSSDAMCVLIGPGGDGARALEAIPVMLQLL